MHKPTVLFLVAALSAACEEPDNSGTGTEQASTQTGQSSGDSDSAPVPPMTEGTGDDGAAGTTTSGAPTTGAPTTGAPTTGDPTTGGQATDADTETDSDAESTGADPYDAVYASVTSVDVTGEAGSYTFAVGVFSPDTGCEQYANWWEVVTEDEELLFRRILTHSHVPPQFKQPFVRSGAPVVVSNDQTVIVRAHMNTSGFGHRTFRGSVDEGFTPYETAADFGAELEDLAPQPGACPF